MSSLGLELILSWGGMTSDGSHIRPSKTFMFPEGFNSQPVASSMVNRVRAKSGGISAKGGEQIWIEFIG